MRTELLADEEILHEGFANRPRRLGADSGRLYLTDRRLIFEPHGLRANPECNVIDLDAVVRVAGSWTRLFKVVPLLPNSITVKTAEHEHRFVVWGRQEWIDAIREQARLNDTPSA